MTFCSKSTIIERVIAAHTRRLFNSGHGPWAVAAAINLAFNAPRIEKRLEVLEQLENPPKKITIPGSISYYDAKRPQDGKVYELDQTEQHPGYFTKLYDKYAGIFTSKCEELSYSFENMDSFVSEGNKIHLSESIRIF